MAKRPIFRTDSTLGNLPPERQEEIVQFIDAVTEGDRYEATRLHLAEDGIKVSRTAVWSWHAAWCLRRDVSSEDEFAHEVEQAVEAMKLGLTPEQLSAVGQFVFTKLAAKNRDSKEFREMEWLRLGKETAATKARQKDEELKLGARRVSVMERKLAEIEKTVGDTKLSAEAQAARIREIFKKQ